MQVTKIECPGCHAKYTLKAKSIAAMADRRFQCPKCKFSAPFGQVMPRRTPASTTPTPPPIPRPVPPIPPTAPATPPPLNDSVAGNKTRVGANHVSSVILEVKETGKNFKIKPGVYTIGRDSSDSKATLRISPDIYLGRLHARLDYIEKDGIPTVILSGLNPKNPIRVNNLTLNDNMRVKLKDGCNLLLGMTNVTVRIKSGPATTPATLDTKIG